MRRSATSYVIGMIAGCACATLILMFADSSGLARALMYPFALIGFVLGNVHQGSAIISIASLYLVFAVVGAVLGAGVGRLLAARSDGSTGT